METEVKFSPVDERCFRAMLADRALSRPVTPLRRLKMETVYYDDPAHILSAHGWTLRLRRENGRGVCTFKGRASGLSRLELETAAETVEEGARQLALLPELPPQARTALRAERFLPVCGASFVRQVQKRQTEELTFFLSWDEGWLFRGEHSAPFTEAELELCSGTEQALSALAEKYRRRFGLAVCSRSKQQRAMALEEERI